MEDSAIMGGDSVMVGGRTGLVGSVGRVWGNSGTSGVCCCCGCSWGISVAGAGFMRG